MKIINQRKAPKDFREKFLPRELEILQTIRNDNLVNMYDIFKLNGKVRQVSGTRLVLLRFKLDFELEISNLASATISESSEGIIDL